MVIFGRRGIDLYHKTCIPLQGNASYRQQPLSKQYVYTFRYKSCITLTINRISTERSAVYKQSLSFGCWFFFLENSRINSHTGYTVVLSCYKCAKIEYICNFLLLYIFCKLKNFNSKSNNFCDTFY